jgi:hypothetical protein
VGRVRETDSLVFSRDSYVKRCRRPEEIGSAGSRDATTYVDVTAPVPSVITTSMPSSPSCNCSFALSSSIPYTVPSGARSTFSASVMRIVSTRAVCRVAANMRSCAADRT